MRVSFSKISSYYSCPRKFYVDYVLKKSVFKDSIYTIYGTSIHETVQLILVDMFDKKLKSKNEYFDFFKQQFKDRFPKLKYISDNQKRDFTNYGLETIAFFYKNKDKYYGDPMYSLGGIEMDVLVNYKENIDLYCLIDAVIYDKYDKKVIIDDFKTSMRGWGNKEKKNKYKILQLLFYKFILMIDDGSDNYDEILPRYIVFKNIAFAPKGIDVPAQRVQTIKPASGKFKMKEVKEILDDFIDKNIDVYGNYIDRGIENYESIKSNNCKYCEYAGSEYCSIKK